MDQLATRAHVVKLARVLAVPPESLAYLNASPPAEVRTLREALYEHVLDLDMGLVRRLAALVRWLPAWLTAWLAPRIGGAFLIARVAGELPARLAARIAARLPPVFLAEVCLDIDPRRVRDIIRWLPPPAIVAVARGMIARRDFVTLGRFADFLPDAAIQAVLEQIDDDEQLLRVSYFMESANRLDHVVRLLPRERLRRMVLLALDPQRDVLVEAFALIAHVGYALKRELGDLAAAQAPAVLDRIVQLTQAQGLWGDLLPIVSVLSAEHQCRVVNLPILREPGVLDAALAATYADDLWLDLLPLVTFMQEDIRDATARAAARLPAGAITQAATAALTGEHWEPLLDIVARMPEARQDEIVAIVQDYGRVDPELRRRVQQRAAEFGLAM